MSDTNYILLIEDNDDDIELTKLAFQENNLANDIKIIKDGEDALDFLLGRDSTEMKELGKPTFILLDINLPKVSGLEILKNIRSDKRIKHIPVIMLTTSQQEDDLITSYDLGANSYVRKPVNYQDFVKVINNLGIYWLAINLVPKDEQ